jgi:hypothetical protein
MNSVAATFENLNDIHEGDHVISRGILLRKYVGDTVTYCVFTRIDHHGSRVWDIVYYGCDAQHGCHDGTFYTALQAKRIAYEMTQA